MYIVRKKSSSNIYAIKPMPSKRHSVEVKSYIANKVCAELPREMKATIHSMSDMIVHEMVKGGNH